MAKMKRNIGDLDSSAEVTAPALVSGAAVFSQV